MADKKHILTYEGLKKYEDELQDLKVNRRREIAQKIKEAREQGDLSENAEYDAAKDEQRDIEARIEELEKLLKNAEVVVEDEVNLDKINIGCVVKVKLIVHSCETTAELFYACHGHGINVVEVRVKPNIAPNMSPKQFSQQSVGNVLCKKSFGKVLSLIHRWTSTLYTPDLIVCPFVSQFAL